MVKKSFKGGFDSLLKGDRENYENSVIINNSATKIENYVRYTTIVDRKTLDKIKFIALWKRKNIKEIFEESLCDYVNKYEDKNGQIILPNSNIVK